LPELLIRYQAALLARGWPEHLAHNRVAMLSRELSGSTKPAHRDLMMKVLELRLEAEK